jgi:hypothetical protein
MLFPVIFIIQPLIIFAKEVLREEPDSGCSLL